MRIAVMGDIHGNYDAFEKCVKEALKKKADSFIFLGDYLADMPDPQKVMGLLYELNDKYKCWFIRGNKERYWIHHRQTEDKNEWIDNCSASGMLFYTYSNLKDSDIDFFETLPISRKIDFKDAPSITICHGSPNRDNEELVRGTEATDKILEASDTDYILCAHTHRQWIYEHAGKKLLNPGSVGLPLGSFGKAQFAIIENTENEWKEEFYSISYNIEKVICDMDKEGLPTHAPCWVELTKKTLRFGKPYHMNALIMAMNLCEQQTGSCNWPKIPENCWQEALKVV